MKQDELLRKIKQKAKQDARHRRDPRFLRVLGFLVAKGFLKTNLNVHPTPNQRVKIADAIWAGRNVEPRILEVLPAAVLRLGKHFDFECLKDRELARVVHQLRDRKETGDGFNGIPYEKIRVWADFPLKDGRVKASNEKKITKTFRLSPQAISQIKELAKKFNCSDTEALERKLAHPDRSLQE